MRISAIIPAAGSGTRYSKIKNKLMEDLGGIPVLARTIKAISQSPRIDKIIICTSEELIPDIREIIKENNFSKVTKIIRGGSTRQESVYLGLQNTEEADIALIHDAARPFVTIDIIENAIDCAIKNGNCIAAVPVKDTIKKINLENKQILETVNRSNLFSVQTPQVFKFEDIINAHKKFEGQSFTDDAGLLEANGIKVYQTNGSYKNIKITTSEDIILANLFLKETED